MSAAEDADDLTIPDDAVVWRRVPPYHVIYDDNLGRHRPTSDAFKDDPDGEPMSVALADSCDEPATVLQGHEGFALAGMTAGFLRQHSQKIVRKPTPEEPWHAVVIGKKTDSLRKKLAKLPEIWVVNPRGI